MHLYVLDCIVINYPFIKRIFKLSMFKCAVITGNLSKLEHFEMAKDIFATTGIHKIITMVLVCCSIAILARTLTLVSVIGYWTTRVKMDCKLNMRRPKKREGGKEDVHLFHVPPSQEKPIHSSNYNAYN